jgi:hypothetical protein
MQISETILFLETVVVGPRLLGLIMPAFRAPHDNMQDETKACTIEY